MCDFSAITVFLAAAEIAVAVAVALIAAAVVANSSLFLLPNSPGLMWAATAATIAAAGSIGAVAALLNTPGCSSATCINPLGMVGPLFSFLIVQVLACQVATQMAGVPWAGAFIMGAIGWSLANQLAAWPALANGIVALEHCLRNIPPAVPVTSDVGLYGSLTVGAIILITMWIMILKYGASTEGLPPPKG